MINQQNITVSQEQYHISILVFGGIELLIPQNEVVSIESLYKLDIKDEIVHSVGKLLIQGKNIPIYCFSENMTLLSYIPIDRMQCVIIRHTQGLIGILCNEINNITLNHVSFESIPGCMNSHTNPITHFCLYKEDKMPMKLGLVTDATWLYYYIENKA